MHGLDATSVAVCLAISVVGGTFRGFAGFGSGLIMSPILLVFLPPVVAVPMLCCMEVFASLNLAYNNRKSVEWGRVVWFAGPAILTIIAGAAALSVADPLVVRKVVAVVVLVTVLIMAKGWRYAGRLGPGVSAFAGAFSGFLSGLAGVGGPPVALTMLADESPEHIVRANLIGFFFISGMVAILNYALQGMLTVSTLTLAVLGVVPFMASVQLGAWVFRKTGGRHFRVASLVLLGIVGLAGLAT